MSAEPSNREHHGLTRRQVLQVYGAGVVAVGGGALAAERLGLFPDNAPERILATSADVAALERRRPQTGQIRSLRLTAAPTDIDLAGKQAATWAFNGATPHSEIRATAGDVISARLDNQLPDPTTIHWHGLALRNDMDGVPNVTRPAIPAKGSFTYRFTAPDPGTYWFHPHVGVQLDRGLYGPLIIEDPQEPLAYDSEAILVLDDWTDGISTRPDQILADMQKQGMRNMGSMSSMNGMSPNSSGMGITADKPLGADTGDVDYPLHLINGHPPADPIVLSAKPGQRLRLRIINAASDTAYRFAIGGHKLNVVHTDGYPVVPVTTDTLVIGMGERYDVIVEASDGAFPIVAQPEGKTGSPGFAVLRTASGATPPPTAAELKGRLLTYAQLAPAPDVRLPKQTADRTLKVDLTMKNGGRQWLINGKAYPGYKPLNVKTGERVQLDFTNRTMMFHPMHVHGHTFALVQNGSPGVRKDTLNVLPMQRLSVVLDASNPGQWLVHCHNAYHGELGMMTVLSYIR